MSFWSFASVCTVHGIFAVYELRKFISQLLNFFLQASKLSVLSETNVYTFAIWSTSDLRSSRWNRFRPEWDFLLPKLYQKRSPANSRYGVQLCPPHGDHGAFKLPQPRQSNRQLFFSFQVRTLNPCQVALTKYSIQASRAITYVFFEENISLTYGFFKNCILFSSKMVFFSFDGTFLQNNHNLGLSSSLLVFYSPLVFFHAECCKQALNWEGTCRWALKLTVEIYLRQALSFEALPSLL